MELQSRFGTDPRFHMDAKFLESDEEEQQQGQMILILNKNNCHCKRNSSNSS